MNNGNLDPSKMTDEQKHAALLWYADTKKGDIAKASNISDPNVIQPGNQLDFNSLLSPIGNGAGDSNFQTSRIAGYENARTLKNDNM